MKLDVYNIEGKSTGRSVELPAEIFGVEPNNHSIYLAVKQYLANQRQGTHKAKERGEIVGSTRKIKRQKGTGTARAGSIKSGIMRGGGRMFGPRPRTYGIKLNTKVRRLARASALSTKMGEGKIKIIEDFTFDQPKTKEYLNVLKNLDVNTKKTLMVVGDYDQNLYKSGRNIQNTTLVNAKDLNTYEIVNAQEILISEGSIGKISEAFAS
jgi:large subunit ribosomal protein L4